jgi:hypothetical protein
VTKEELALAARVSRTILLSFLARMPPDATVAETIAAIEACPTELSEMEVVWISHEGTGTLQ